LRANARQFHVTVGGLHRQLHNINFTFIFYMILSFYFPSRIYRISFIEGDEGITGMFFIEAIFFKLLG
jgi:hypothetical protein